MSVGLWPFLPSLCCVMWIAPIKADSHRQGYLLAKTLPMQSITTWCVCVYIFLYIYSYICKLQKNIKYIKIKI